MSNYFKDTDYMIGVDSTHLISLRNLHIPVPDQVTFQPASVYSVRADFQRIGDGWAMCSWIWDVISVATLSNLLAFLGGDDSKAVFIRTDLRDGTVAKPENAFHVYSAVMWKPLLFGQDGTPVARSPYALQTVNVQFVNLIDWD